jgi:hypothetical protein
MRKSYLLDTGPLHDYLAVLYLRSNGSGNWGDLTIINTEVKMAAFERFVDEHRPLLTVSGVFAEVSGLFQSKYRKSRLYGPNGFWRNAWPIVGEARASIEESALPLRALGIDMVQAVGPVDASLVKKGLEIREKGGEACIITSDSELMTRCRHFQVPTQHVNEILWSTEGRA